MGAYIFEFLPMIRMATWIVGLSGGNSFSFNVVTRRFQVRNLKSVGAIVPMIVCGCQLFAVTIRMGVVLKTDAMMNHITDLLIYIANAMAYFMGIVSFRKAHEIVDCYNCLLTMATKSADKDVQKCYMEPKKNLRKAVSYAWELNKVALVELKKGEIERFMMMTCPSCQVALPFLILLFILETPCSSQVFLRSAFADCPNHGFQWMPAGLAPLSVFFDVYYIFYAWGQGCNCIGVGFLTLALCIRDELKRIRKTSTGLTNMEEAVENVRRYKVIQILERQFNNINRGGFIVIFMMDMTFLGVTSLYSTIALHDVMPVPILVLSIIMAVETVILAQMVMYGIAADLNTISGETKNCWKFNRVMQMSKYLKRLGRSCMQMKTLVGNSGNFVEKTTPLISMQMTVDQTASLLLIRD